MVEKYKSEKIKATIILNNAMAMRDLFNYVSNTLHPPKDELREKLTSDYMLSSAQKKNLDLVLNNVYNTMFVIDSVKEHYKIDKQGHFLNKVELYNSVYKSEPPKRFSCEPYKFAIGFNLPQSEFDKSTYGDTNGSCMDIGYLLQQNIKSIKKNNYSNLNLMPFCFRINYKRIRQDSKKKIIQQPPSIGNFLRSILQPDLQVFQTKNHELKHIIDLFIESNNGPWLREVSADLYEGKLRKDAIKRDVGYIEESINKGLDRLERLENLSAPNTLIENELKSLEKKEQMIKAMNSFPLGLINQLHQKGIDKKTLSYIVGMTSFPELEETLKLLNKYH